MIGCQLELETVSGEGCAPEIPVVSRRESIMVELTKHIPGITNKREVVSSILGDYINSSFRAV